MTPARRTSAAHSPGRRTLLKFGGIVAVSSLAGCQATPARTSAGRVVVIGAGFGGATAAKYLRLWSDGAIDVTLVEPGPAFVSCPISNLVLGGHATLAEITLSYRGLDKYGVRRIRDTAVVVDADRRRVRLASGATLDYDRLVVSPGIEFLWDQVQGMSPAAAEVVPHAWKAGPQTRLLRTQLEAMPDGGVVVISMPSAPYRCPPGPYERACQIASYFKASKPRSKLLLLDANADYVSKKPLFSRVFAEDYAGIVEHRPRCVVTEVDVRGRAFVLETGERIGGDVLNLIPPQRAADIARDAGLVTANGRWCEVDWTTMESIQVKGVHVLGDATLSAPAMPKSGHMANQHGKAAAAAIVDLLHGRSPVPTTMANTCYSFIDGTHAVHVASVHRYAEAKRTMETVAGSGGISSQDRPSWAAEGRYAWSWARTIWADMLA
jgi:NADPH-dependent 2,4-dienoyl-CoA reductase/sulfur reductase-like enzyme